MFKCEKCIFEAKYKGSGSYCTYPLGVESAAMSFHDTKEFPPSTWMRPNDPLQCGRKEREE